MWLQEKSSPVVQQLQLRKREDGKLKRSKSQILLTGVYRTGTEYLTQLIDCHPQISATMYRVNVLRFIYGRYDPITDPKNQKKALTDLNERMQQRYGLTVSEEKVFAFLQNIPEETYGDFYDAVMTVLYLQEGREHWLEKNQLLWREIPLFLEMMPNGKAILLIRDPRSVLASFKRFTTAPEPLYLGAIFNCVDAMRFAKEYSEQLPASQFYTLRYEDLARDPKRYVEQIWKFIGVEGNSSLSQEQWRDAEGNPWTHNSAFETDSKTFDVEAAITRWKNQLTSEELALTELVCGELMQPFGYELSGNAIEEEHARTCLQNNKTLLHYYEHWKHNGEGIEAFPSDPLNPSNWSKKE